MRPIELLVVHCSATRESQDISAADIDRWHRDKGWRKIGYHYVIRRSGEVQQGRQEHEAGAHVAGHNAKSIGICMVGGLAADGKTPQENYTAAQYDALGELLDDLTYRFPRAKVLGHRDLSPDRNGDGRVSEREWLKACPCFDAGRWYAARVG